MRGMDKLSVLRRWSFAHYASAVLEFFFVFFLLRDCYLSWISIDRIYVPLLHAIKIVITDIRRRNVTSLMYAFEFLSKIIGVFWLLWTWEFQQYTRKSGRKSSTCYLLLFFLCVAIHSACAVLSIFIKNLALTTLFYMRMKEVERKKTHERIIRR